VFASKLLVGLSWVIGLSEVFLLVYACWAARPGHVAVPFAWSMTTWAWQQWIVMPLIYLGAFLAGIRPARWWGTRLAPLAAVMLMAVVAVNMPWLWLTLLLAIVFSAPLVGAIFYYVHRRDY
jgi:hypothetical protein